MRIVHTVHQTLSLHCTSPPQRFLLVSITHLPPFLSLGAEYKGKPTTCTRRDPEGHSDWTNKCKVSSPTQSEAFYSGGPTRRINQSTQGQSETAGSGWTNYMISTCVVQSMTVIFELRWGNKKILKARVSHRCIGR